MFRPAAVRPARSGLESKQRLGPLPRFRVALRTCASGSRAFCLVSIFLRSGSVCPLSESYMPWAKTRSSLSPERKRASNAAAIVGAAEDALAFGNLLLARARATIWLRQLVTHVVVS